MVSKLLKVYMYLMPLKISFKSSHETNYNLQPLIFEASPGIK